MRLLSAGWMKNCSSLCSSLYGALRWIASLTAAQLLALLMGAGKPGDNYFVDISAYVGLNILPYEVFFIGRDVRVI